MIERRFIDWSAPALPTLAERLAELHAADGRLDLSHLLLAFPGRRPIRRMTELLVAEAEARALRLVPPRATSLGALPEMLYRPMRPLAEVAVTLQAWRVALLDTPAPALEPIVPDPPDPDDLSGWTEIARTLDGLNRDVGAAGLDFADVAEVCRSGTLSYDDSRRWNVLSRVQARWLDILADLGRSERNSARTEALAEGRIGEGPGLPEIHLVGVAEMGGIHRAMIGAAAEATAVTAWVHAPESLADHFDQLGCVNREQWGTANVPVSDDCLAVQDGPAEQASEAVRALAEYGERFAADEVTVGMPDRSLTPWIEQRLSAYGVPHRDPVGLPLDSTGPFRLLEAVADYLDGHRFTDLAALLRHPDLETLLGRVAADDPPPETADQYFAEHLPATLRWRHDGNGTRVPALASSGRGQSLDRLLRALHGPDVLGSLAESGSRRTISGWMPPVLDFLARVYGGRQLDWNRPAQRELVEACTRIRDEAAALHGLPSALDVDCGPGDAIRLLLSGLRGPNQAIPPEPERSAVEMLGWLELHLDDAPALVLTGANDGFLPQSVNADLFLPDRVRSRLGILDNAGRYARDAYLLSAILHSRKALRVVAGRADGRGDPLRPSRLLLTDEGPALARRLLRFLRGDPQRHDADLPPLGIGAAETSRFRIPPERDIPLPEAPESLHVTECGLLLRDPFRWVLERRLGLRELHDGDQELDPLRFGSLAHDVLQRFGQGDEHLDARDGGDPDAVRDCLRGILDRRMREIFPSCLPTVPVQVEQLRSRLDAFARWHAAWTREGWRVWGAEVQPAGDGVIFDVDGVPIRLRGRIDRVDVHEESGRIAILDYKTGDRPADPEKAHRSRDGTWTDLQLPLYRHLVPHLHSPEGGPLADLLGSGDGTRNGSRRGASEILLGYVRLPRDEGKVEEVFVNWNEEVLASAYEEVRRIVRWLRETERVPFDPVLGSAGPWDPLGELLGRGVLVTSRGDDEDDGGEPR